MKPQSTLLTQSKFYSPAFNAAIFDGSLKLYFAQYQEPLALKLYFQMQDQLHSYYAILRDGFKVHGQNVFVMLYPTTEIFDMSFDGTEGVDPVVVSRPGLDYVIGLRGLKDEIYFSTVIERLKTIALTLQREEPLPRSPMQESAL